MAGAIPSNINPNTTSGTDLATLLNLFKDSFASMNSGTSRPSNIQVGGLWWDTTLIANPDYVVVLKMYDGSDDITMLSLNISTNTVSISDSNSIFRITRVSDDTVGPLLKLIKTRIAGAGQAANGDSIGQVQFIGEDNGGLFPIICEIKAVATDNVTPTAQGGYLVFSTTDDATGTMLEKMRLVDSKLGIGTTAPESILHILGATGARIAAALTNNTVGALLSFRKKRTANSGKVLSGDDIGKVSFNSTDDAGTEITEAVTLEVSAVEDHTSTAHGSQLRIYVKKATQTTKTLMITFADTITVAVASAFSTLATFNAHLRLSDLGSKYVTLKSAASMSADYDFVYPDSVGADGYVLRKKAGGGTEWASLTLTAETKNDFVNSTFHSWQRGTSATRTNGQRKYLADMWCVRNALGTNGVLTNSRVAATSDGAAYANKVLITTAPTSGQTNGCEMYYIFENIDSLKYYNKIASMSAYIKAFGNVNQVGLQFMYATSEILPSSTIGSETLVTVNTSTFTLGSILAQAIGTGMTAAGVIGVRIRITAVSSGNTYDLNNGFSIELPNCNLGSTALTHSPHSNVADEAFMARRRYQRVALASAMALSATTISVNTPLVPPMRAIPGTQSGLLTITLSAAPALTHSGGTFIASDANLSSAGGDAKNATIGSSSFSGLTTDRTYPGAYDNGIVGVLLCEADI